MTTYDNKPIMGYIFTYNDSLISWSSKCSSLVTLLVTKAELYALAHASTKAIYLKSLIDELLNYTMNPVKMYTDSASTIAIICSPEEQHSQRTKHFDIRKNFIGDCIEKKHITIHHVSSNDQCANTLTKVLPLEKLKHFNELLHVHAWRGVFDSRDFNAGYLLCRIYWDCREYYYTHFWSLTLQCDLRRPLYSTLYPHSCSLLISVSVAACIRINEPRLGCGTTSCSFVSQKGSLIQPKH